MNQFFQISIPIPDKPEEDELQAILKVGEKILFLAVYPFGEVPEEHKEEIMKIVTNVYGGGSTNASLVDYNNRYALINLEE